MNQEIPEKNEEFYDEALIEIIKRFVNECKGGQELKSYISTNKPSFNLIESQFSKAVADNELLQKNLKKVFDSCVQTGVQRVFIRVLLSYLKKNNEKLNLKVVKDEGIANIWKSLTPQELEEFIEIFDLREQITQNEQFLFLSSLVQHYQWLINKKKYDDAIQFYKAVNLDQKHFTSLMDAMANNNDAGRAADYIKRMNYDSNLYPNIVERLQKSCVRYIYKEYSWFKCEEMLLGFPSLLAYLCEDAYHKGQKLEALSMIKRNNLIELIKKQDIKNAVQEDFKQGFAELDNIIFTKDEFKPVDEIVDGNAQFLHCSDFGYQENQIVVIEEINQQFTDAWEQIKTADAIGFDTEHVTAMTKLDEQGLQVYLVQIATKQNTFLFDFQKLKNEIEFKKNIKECFENNATLKVGLSLKDDLKNVVNQLKLRPIIIRSIFELSTCFKDLEGDPKSRSLAYLAEFYYKKPLSKLDTCSNWAYRPLRKAQIHYAALDAIASLHVFLAMRNVNQEITEQEKDALQLDE